MSERKPTPQATSMAFERRYSDGSGVQYAVRLIGDAVEFEAVDTVAIPYTELDWLMMCLERIRAEREKEGR